jgi:hypothetical protein
MDISISGVTTDFVSLKLVLLEVNILASYFRTKLNYTPWPEFASELYRSSDRRLSAKLVPTFAERGCHVVSVADPSGHILGFLDRSRNFSFK